MWVHTVMKFSRVWMYGPLRNVQAGGVDMDAACTLPTFSHYKYTKRVYIDTAGFHRHRATTSRAAHPPHALTPRTPPTPATLPRIYPPPQMNIGQHGAASGGGPGGGDGSMVIADHNVKAEPALGAAALERVVAAAKAAHEDQQRSAEDQRAVCDLCNVRRADLRGPCGHKYHARECWCWSW